MTEAERQALERVRKFVFRAKKLIEGISVEHLIEEGGVNPYMAKALGMKTIDEVVEFFVNRRVERSLGTSFGNVLDDVLRTLLGGLKGRKLVAKYGDWIGWWDAVLLDRKIVIAIKSGPADMDKDQVLYFVQQAKVAEAEGFRPFLVFAYGKQAFPVIESYLQDEGFAPEKYLRIGKAVFEEFLVNNTYYKEALKIFGIAGKEAGDIFALVEERIRLLTAELKKRYGNDVNKMLEDMF
ncbi:MAG: PmeII family type II restriction endonuclease [Candidatus Jordarchaeales archaeon]